MTWNLCPAVIQMDWTYSWYSKGMYRHCQSRCIRWHRQLCLIMTPLRAEILLYVLEITNKVRFSKWHKAFLKSEGFGTLFARGWFVPFFHFKATVSEMFISFISVSPCWICGWLGVVVCVLFIILPPGAAESQVFKLYIYVVFSTKRLQWPRKREDSVRRHILLYWEYDIFSILACRNKYCNHKMLLNTRKIS